MHEDFEVRRAARRRFLRNNVAWIAPLGIAAAFGLFFGIGKLVEWLWRVTVVDIFAFKPISFWQAWGLILLSQILFKANLHQTMRTGPRRHFGSRGDAPKPEPENS